MALQETGHHHGIRLPRVHVPQKAEIIGISAAAGTLFFGAGLAVDRYALPHNTNTIDVSTINGMDGSRFIIPEVKPGDEINPIKGSAITSNLGGFQHRVFKIVQTSEELDSILNTVSSESSGLPLNYDFDPEKEVIVVAGLGNGLYHAQDAITGLKAVAQPDGRVEVQLQRNAAFISHYPPERFPTSVKSPVIIARYDRVSVNGREAVWTTSVDDDVNHIPAYTLGPNGEFNLKTPAVTQ